MYDWANSSFATTVLTAFFPFFFKSFWNQGVDPALSTARLGFATGTAGLIVALLSPVLGGIADAGHAGKKFLTFFIFLGITATGALYYVPMGHWQTASILIIMAEAGFSIGNMFYDSFLVKVAPGEEMDMVSSMGYAAGYAGGGILFLINLFMIWKPAFFGIDTVQTSVKISFITVSVWWLVFSLPFLFFVKEGANQARNTLIIIAEGLNRLKETAVKICSRKALLIFLIAYWLYIDGIYTVIFMATDFGLAIGLSPFSLMLSILLVQFVAFPSSIGFGFLARRMGTEKAILCGIGMYLCVCTAGTFLLRTSIDFMIVAAIVGMAQGGVQSLSRSYFAKIIPKDESAEYFGFFNMIGKFSAVLGPILVGGIAYFLHTCKVASGLTSRISMSSIVLFFIAGGLLLLKAESERKKTGLLHEKTRP
jgi:UMF1 family MFS transporter